MRSDSVGLWWQDFPQERGRSAIYRPQPPIPETGWLPPKEFPNLAAAKSLAIDTETYDPNLLTHGPGWARNDGHIVGMSVATDDGHRWYFPMRHTVNDHLNMDPDNVLAWAKDALGREDQPKVGANLTYDVGWLGWEKVIVRGKLYDVQFAEALIDEFAKDYSLDGIAERYLGVGKETNHLYQWLADFYGGKPNGTQRANIYRSPPELAGPYGESDALLPMEVLKKQWPILQKMGLLDLFDIECRLIRMLIDMRMRGVRVDLDYAEQLRDKLTLQEAEYQKELDKVAGIHVEVYTPTSIQYAFDKAGIAYPRTAKGAPSFRKDWLQSHDSKVANLITKVRQMQKARGTFVENFVLEKNVEGRLFCQFHPLKSDDGGTVSGRFSSKTPNLQQIPKRDKVIGPMMRKMFVPDHGYDAWVKLDYSQIEYRLLAHFAVGRGSDEVRRRYASDPKTDYHQMTTDIVYNLTNVMLEREPTKNINFGLCYGMMEKALRSMLGLTKAEGRELFDTYHAGVPFVKETFEYFMQVVQSTGISRTILNRQTRFKMWESSVAWRSQAMKYEDALETYGTQIQRAYAHKGLNRTLQGSAADLLKKAMVDAYESGVFNELGGVPHLTVHDELDLSFMYKDREPLKRLVECMQDAVKLNIPVILDVEYGPNWGELSDLPLD